jgi:glycosyltransferase involved in cell wall biosynthesis
VVAPAGGGPATYVEQGATGLLVDTQSWAELAAGLLAALGLAADPTSERRAEAARALVRERFTVQAMARTLAGVYVGVSAPAHR